MRRLNQGLDSSPTAPYHLYSTDTKIPHRYWCAKSVISAVLHPSASGASQAANLHHGDCCGRRTITCTCTKQRVVNSVVRTAIRSGVGTKLSAARSARLLAHQHKHEISCAQSSRRCRCGLCTCPDLTLATGAVGQHHLARHRCDASPWCAPHCTMKFAVRFPNVRTDIY